MEDFTLIDRRMGTLAELRTLTQAAHARGIYVLVDIVVNHMADKLGFEGVPSDQGSPFVTHADEYRLFSKSSADPAEQPYTDFQYNNTWDPDGTYTVTHKYYDKYGNGFWDNGTGTYSHSDFHHNGDLRCLRPAHTHPLTRAARTPTCWLAPRAVPSPVTGLAHQSRSSHHVFCTPLLCGQRL